MSKAARASLLAAVLVACTSAPPTPAEPSDAPTGRLLVLETKPCNWLQGGDPNRCDAVGLALIDLEGEKLEDLTPDPSDAPIAFNSFALSSSRDRVAWTWNWELNVMAFDDREPRLVNEKVLAANQGERSSDPTWSPDGREVIYRSVGPNMVSTWYRVVVETGERAELKFRVDCWAMAWSPDGKSIACEVPQQFQEDGRQTERADIYVVTPETLATSPVTTEGDDIDDRRPDWSPDGEWLAIARSTNDASLADDINGIWLLPVAGGDGTRIATGLLSVPTWSPDGNHLAAFDDESMRIVIFGRDGSGFTTLEHEPRLFVAPRWIGD